MANGISLSKLRRDIKRTEKKFTPQEVGQAIQQSGIISGGVQLWDSVYWAVPDSVWLDIIQHSGVDKRKYVAERFDCDDFAFAFKGMVSEQLQVNGCGIVADAGSQHAYIVILVKTNSGVQAKFLEPQNDRLVPVGTRSHSGRGMFIIL